MNRKLEIQINNGGVADAVIASSKDEALAGLKNARVLVLEMIKMVEESKPCVEIMQKNMAAVAYLRRSHEMIMQGNLGVCFKKAATNKSPEESTRIREEMLGIIKMFYK